MCQLGNECLILRSEGYQYPASDPPLPWPMNDDPVTTPSQNPGRVQSGTGFESPVHMFRNSCIKGDRAGGVIQEGKGRIESPENLNNFVGVQGSHSSADIHALPHRPPLMSDVRRRRPDRISHAGSCLGSKHPVSTPSLHTRRQVSLSSSLHRCAGSRISYAAAI
jgi:hypothetical protein